MYQDNRNFYAFGGPELGEFWGLLYSYHRSLNGVDIGFSTRTNLYIAGNIPDFSALGLQDHNIHLTYRLSQKERERRQEAGVYRDAWEVSGLAGMRVFRVTGHRVFPGEKFSPIGLSAALGLEFLWKKHNLSFNLERDAWISFNAGSPVREVKGYISSTLFGLKWHHAFRNERTLRLGLGYSLIRDIEKQALLTVEDHNGALGRDQVKGLGASAAYEVFPKTDLELKHTFPIKSLDEPLFNPLRFSIGIVRRFVL